MPEHTRPAASGSSAAAPAPLPLEPGQTIVFLGDNITAARPGWIEVLAQALGHRRPTLTLRFVNAGQAGDTIRDLESRLATDVLAWQPAWVVICIGANDYAPKADGNPSVPLPEFVARYEALVRQLREAGSRPVLLTIPVVGLAGEDHEIQDPGAYNTAIRDLARTADLPLVDLYQAFRAVYERAANYKQVVTLSPDGIHPNRQGHALIARTILLELGLLDK